MSRYADARAITPQSVSAQAGRAWDVRRWSHPASARDRALPLELDLDKHRRPAAGVDHIVLGAGAAEIRHPRLLDQLASAAIRAGDREGPAGHRHHDVVVLV